MVLAACQHQSPPLTGSLLHRTKTEKRGTGRKGEAVCLSAPPKYADVWRIGSVGRFQTLFVFVSMIIIHTCSCRYFKKSFYSSGQLFIFGLVDPRLGFYFTCFSNSCLPEMVQGSI